MEALVNRCALLTVFILLHSDVSFALPCQGKGTVIFFGNGMLVTRSEARKNLNYLKELSKNDFKAPGKELKYELAYKNNEFLPEQVIRVAVQKGITDFKYFWLWWLGMLIPPPWFKAVLLDNVVLINSALDKKYPDINSHFEGYKKYIWKGYNVLLVSHSQGNFYANQVMERVTKLSLIHISEPTRPY